ncbi:MAG: 50S ribosomal protein L11 methyltransferase [Candidatus Binataceae bacterium]
MATKQKRSTYVKVSFRTPAAMADEAAGFLVANGALGCAIAEFDKPRQRPRKIVTLDAYFARIDHREIEKLRAAMRAAGMLAVQARAPGVHTIADPGWATMWQERFNPFPIGERFLIVPPWNRKPMPGRIALAIKPGRAFGTGHHPSTAGALRAIEELFANRTRFETALDVGTGSGVLAFAMVALGVGCVTAIDVDADALENARENAKLNSMSAEIRFATTPIEQVRGRFDLITANILRSVLIAMAPTLMKRLKRDGRLVLGGILASEASEVIRGYRPLRVAGSKRSRGWATLVMAK